MGGRGVRPHSANPVSTVVPTLCLDSSRSRFRTLKRLTAQWDGYLRLG